MSYRALMLRLLKFKKQITVVSFFFSSVKKKNNKPIKRFWRSGDRAMWQILIIKPTRCTNLSNLFLNQDGPSWSCSQAVSKPVWHTPLLCIEWKTPDDEQRNFPKHVEFYSKNKFEKSVHLFGFIIGNIKRNVWLTDLRSYYGQCVYRVAQKNVCTFYSSISLE